MISNGGGGVFILNFPRWQLERFFLKMAKIRCFSDIEEGKSDILKGLVGYPLG